MNPQMSMPRLVTVICVLAFIVLLPAGTSRSRGGERESRSVPVPEELRAELLKLFEKYYPKATVAKVGNIDIEYEATTFEDPPYTGSKKHAARTRHGPKAGGIMCEISAGKGRYSGQVVPHLKKYPEYNLRLMAPYSPNRDIHLWVRLSYPPDTSEDFLNEFRAIIKGFE